MSWRANNSDEELSAFRSTPWSESRRSPGNDPEPFHTPTYRMPAASERGVREDLDEETRARKNDTSSLGRRCEALERALAALQRGHEDLRDERGSNETQRLDNLESRFEALADRQRRDVASLTSAAEQSANGLAAAKAKIDSLSAAIPKCENCGGVDTFNSTEIDQRLEKYVKDLDSLRREQASMASQVKQKFAELHDLVLHHAETNRENLRSAANHDNTAKAFVSIKAKLDQVQQTALNCEGRLPGLADRLRDMETKLDRRPADENEHLERAVKALQSNADQTANALAAAIARLDSMQSGAINYEQRCSAVESKTISLAERLQDSERRLEGSVSQANSLTNRLKESERRLDSAVSKTVEELTALKNEHDQLYAHVEKRLSEPTNLLHQISEHKARIDRHEDQNGVLAANQDGQARDLRGLRDEHSRHGQEIALLRRQVEDALGKVTHSTEQEMRETREELDQVLQWLASVQRAWRPTARSGRSSRKGRTGDEVGTPKTPKAGYEVSMDLVKPGMGADFATQF